MIFLLLLVLLISLCTPMADSSSPDAFPIDSLRGYCLKQSLFHLGALPENLLKDLIDIWQEKTYPCVMHCIPSWTSRESGNREIHLAEFFNLIRLILIGIDELTPEMQRSLFPKVRHYLIYRDICIYLNNMLEKLQNHPEPSVGQTASGRSYAREDIQKILPSRQDLGSISPSFRGNSDYVEFWACQLRNVGSLQLPSLRQTICMVGLFVDLIYVDHIPNRGPLENNRSRILSRGFNWGLVSSYFSLGFDKLQSSAMIQILSRIDTQWQLRVNPSDYSRMIYNDEETAISMFRIEDVKPGTAITTIYNSTEQAIRDQYVGAGFSNCSDGDLVDTFIF